MKVKFKEDFSYCWDGVIPSHYKKGDEVELKADKADFLVSLKKVSIQKAPENKMLVLDGKEEK